MEFVVYSHLLTTITALIHHSFDSSGNQAEHPEARSQRVHGWDENWTTVCGKTTENIKSGKKQTSAAGSKTRPGC